MRQNDLICSPELIIAKNSSAAQIGGYVHASPRTAVTQSNRDVRPLRRAEWFICARRQRGQSRR